jgi:hypothetical protein
MNPLTAPLLVLGLLTSADEVKKPKPNFTVSKATTYVTGPLDKDGYVDFVAALNDLRGKGVTPDTNAAVALWQALGPRLDGQPRPAAFFKALGMTEPPAAGNYFVELTPFLRDRRAIADEALITRIQEQGSITIRRPWTATEFPQLADWLAVNEKPLDRIAEGLRRPHYFVPLVAADGKNAGGLVGLVLGDTQRGRALAAALASRATLRVGEGKPDAAWADVMACFRLARHLARKASLIEGLVAVAVDATGQRAAATLLDRPDVTARQLAGYLRDLRSLPPMPSVADAYEGGERLVALDGLQEAVRTGAGLAGAPGVPNNAEDLDADTLLRRSNQFFDRIAMIGKEPDRPKREAALDRLEADLNALVSARQKGKQPIPGESEVQGTARGIAEILVKLVMPSVRRRQTAVDRSTAGHHILQVAFALAAYQRDHKAYPKALASLAPKYLAKVPDDLFTGKPLVYRPTEKGFLLYSLGPIGKDDEGRWFDDDPKGDDPGVRIPLPRPKK